MQGARLDQLPVELFRHIALHLVPDARTRSLCALSLTNKALRDLAQPALFETVVLDTAQAMQGFAELIRIDSGVFLAGCVRNLSPWKDDFGIVGQPEGRRCAADIIARCPNLLNVQTRGSVLSLIRGATMPQVEEAFVWLEDMLFPPAIFAHTVRLHVADLQRLVSSSSSLPSLTAQNLPNLEYFSSTWAPYQMFEQDHTALAVFARSILLLPRLTRFLVRVVGMVYSLPTLLALKDPRVRVAPFDERDELLSDNLAVWAHSVLRMRSMWTGRPLYREQTVISIVAEPVLDSIGEDEEREEGS